MIKMKNIRVIRKIFGIKVTTVSEVAEVLKWKELKTNYGYEYKEESFISRNFDQGIIVTKEKTPEIPYAFYIVNQIRTPKQNSVKVEDTWKNTERATITYKGNSWQSFIYSDTPEELLNNINNKLSEIRELEKEGTYISTITRKVRDRWRKVPLASNKDYVSLISLLSSYLKISVSNNEIVTDNFSSISISNITDFYKIDKIIKRFIKDESSEWVLEGFPEKRRGDNTVLFEKKYNYISNNKKLKFSLLLEYVKIEGSVDELSLIILPSDLLPKIEKI